MDTELLTITPAATEPIYRQIVGQLRRLIVSGQLPAGEALPSVREVAGHHAINPMTVSRAYSLLEAEGLLERQRGKGMVVAATRRKPQSQDRRLDQLQSRMQELARHAHELDLSTDTVIEKLRAILEDDE